MGDALGQMADLVEIGATGQSQWERPAAAGFTEPFVPAATFLGPQDGYFFSMGPKGLGYYKDGVPLPG